MPVKSHHAMSSVCIEKSRIKSRTEQVNHLALLQERPDKVLSDQNVGQLAYVDAVLRKQLPHHLSNAVEIAVRNSETFKAIAQTFVKTKPVNLLMGRGGRIEDTRL